MTLQEFARKGGHARAKSLSKERRSEIARNAGLASAQAKRTMLSKHPEHANKVCSNDKI